MKKYFVNQNSNIVGPFSEEEVLLKVSNNELKETDMIFCQKQDTWVPIYEHPLLKAEEAAATTIELDNTDKDWFVLRGAKKFGPFEYIELVKMLQNRELMEYDYIWHPTMSKWSRLAEVRNFSPEHIQKLLKEQGEVFYQRKYPRKVMISKVLLHDNFKAWKGENLLISEGGCQARIYNSMMQPGDAVYLHFKPSGEFPAFRAKGEIVSKKFDPHIRDIEHPIIYGVRFTEINGLAVQEIKKYTKSA
tara:strand:+ start:7269 stop:8009 length:741 start_codon:yes stop_codon:yes gene_type:complete